MNIRESFSKVRVLIIGDVMLDRYWWGDVNRISPEAPVPVVRLKGSSYAPGGAANVAANVAGLGAKPILIGVIGTDNEAQELQTAMSEKGLDNSSLVHLEGRPTIVKTRIIAHAQQVVRVDKETSLEISDDEADAVISVAREKIKEADIVIVSDYGKGLLSQSVLKKLIEICRNDEKPIFIDPKGRKYEKYSGATLITPNRKEAADACSLNEEMPDLVATAGRMLVETFGIKNALITQSEQGMTLFRADAEPHHIPATAVETYDVTGAGDTVIATLGVAYAAGKSLADAARLSNLAAGVVVQQIGTTAITIDQLASAADNLG